MVDGLSPCDPDVAVIFEIFESGMVARLEATATKAGFKVERWPPRSPFRLAIAHVAEVAWRNLVDRAPACSVCVAVSTVDRPRVPHPTRTTSSVYCLHLIPGIENLSDEQLQDIFSVLKNRMMLDDLIARPAEACGREYFVTPRFPEILCTLWMLCQAYLNIPTCHPGA